MKMGRLLICIVLLGMTVASGAGREFYVALDGDDGNQGTKGAPFATLDRARDAVRQIKASDGLPAGGITVWIRAAVTRSIASRWDTWVETWVTMSFSDANIMA